MWKLLHAARLASTFSMGESAVSSPPYCFGASNFTAMPFSFFASKR